MIEFVRNICHKIYPHLPLGIKNRVDVFLQGKPGSRFTHYYHSFHKPEGFLLTLLFFIMAVVIFIIGLIFAVLPGPAWVFYGLAIAIVVSRSFRMAKLCDRWEIKLRERWKKYK
jgi:hypothetical protein